MADNKKYYWLKLPKDFFNKHYIKILRANQEHGNLLVMFYIWMLTESIDHEGTLRYSEELPYSPEMLSAVSGFPLQIVTLALQQFTDLKLIVTEENGTIFLPKSLKMIGSETASAERVRRFRSKQNDTPQRQEKPLCNTDVTPRNADVQKSNIEKEKDIEIDKDNKKDTVEKTEAYKTIIEYLNKKTNSHYRHTTKATQRIINGRMKDGFTVEDFKRVIDIKSEQWLGDKKMQGFLRPETLFAASHFESYLNEARASIKPEPKHSGISEKLAKETEATIGATGEYDYGNFE